MGTDLGLVRKRHDAFFIIARGALSRQTGELCIVRGSPHIYKYQVYISFKLLLGYLPDVAKRVGKFVERDTCHGNYSAINYMSYADKPNKSCILRNY